MKDLSTHTRDPDTIAFILCIGSIYDVAFRCIETSDQSAIFDVVETASAKLISLLPEEQSEERAWMRARVLENLLILSFIGESEPLRARSVFDQLCEAGFRSEQRAVLCASYYCYWLKSEGEKRLIPDAIARVGTHITHPFFQNELQAVADRMNRDEPIGDDE